MYLNLLVAITVAMAASFLNLVNCRRNIVIDSGPINGTIETIGNNKNTKKIEQFLGIKYAEADRFELPRRPQSWHKPYLATSKGSKCISVLQPETLHQLNQGESEDCLYLDVFVPRKNKAQRKKNMPKKYAVIVYLHAGGFDAGSKDMYDGGRLAAEGDVIVVIVNYRLGIFGFLAEAGGKFDGFQGNYGLYDQIEALKWVQRNIAKFGGDPGQVTLMGSSAGSVSATLLCFIPAVDKLFHKVILMSGFGYSLWTYRTKTVLKHFYEKQSVATRIYNVIPTQCLSPNNTKSAKINKTCLNERMSTFKLAQLQYDLSIKYRFMFFPLIDGSLITDEPKKLLANATSFKNRSVLLGFNRLDGSLFYNALNPYATKTINRKNFTDCFKELRDKAFSNMFAAIANVPTMKLIDKYFNPNELDQSEIKDDFYEMMTDLLFRYSAQRLAIDLSKNCKTFVYQLSCRPSFFNNDKSRKNKPRHMDMEPFVFGHLGPIQISRYESPAQYFDKVSRRIITMWSRFAKTGSPKPSSKWPSYTESKPAYMNIKEKSQLVNHKLIKKCKNFELFAQLNGHAGIYLGNWPNSNPRPN